MSCRRESGLYRWYANCCRTPVGNTHARVPFVGIVHSAIDPRVSPGLRQERLGPVRFRAYEQFATAPLPADAPPKASPGQLWRTIRLVLGWAIRGLGRPSPFFDARTRAPRVELRVLDAST